MNNESLLKKRRKMAGEMRKRIDQVKKHRDAFRDLAAKAEAMADQLTIELGHMRKEVIIIEKSSAPVKQVDLWQTH